MERLQTLQQSRWISVCLKVSNQWSELSRLTMESWLRLSTSLQEISEKVPIRQTMPRWKRIITITSISQTTTLTRCLTWIWIKKEASLIYQWICPSIQLQASKEQRLTILCYSHNWTRIIGWCRLLQILVVCLNYQKLIWTTWNSWSSHRQTKFSRNLEPKQLPDIDWY